MAEPLESVRNFLDGGGNGAENLGLIVPNQRSCRAAFTGTVLPSALTEPTPLPSVGALVGCYKLLRHIAQGPFGPLYELRAEADSKGLNGLGRLVAVPSDLDPDASRQITEAAWDSMEIRHDHALCVADLVFGQGWILLVHDHSEGTLVRSLQRRCQERQSSFPLSVALRVCMDMLDALDASQRACESSGINWNPGGQSATSLYLCGNGRTRSLDGQIVATLLRTGPVREQVSNLGFPAPELLDDASQPDERTDVFSVGTVMWELLTGRELSLGTAIARGQRPRPNVAKLNLSLPKGASPLPPKLVETVHAALELTAANRIDTRSELRKALTSEAEGASYAQVIDFTDSLLHRESTLFRLTLDTGPKLSDEKRGDRSKSKDLEGVMELAKQAQSKDSTQPSIISRAPSKPQQPAPTPIGGATLVLPAKPRQPSKPDLEPKLRQPSKPDLEPKLRQPSKPDLEPKPDTSPMHPAESKPETKPQAKPEAKPQTAAETNAIEEKGALGANLAVHPSLPFKSDRGLKRTLIGVSPDPTSIPTKLSPGPASPDAPEGAREPMPKLDKGWGKRTLLGIQPDKEPSQPKTQPAQPDAPRNEFLQTVRMANEKGAPELGRTVRIRTDQGLPNWGQTMRVSPEQAGSEPADAAPPLVPGEATQDAEQNKDLKPTATASNAMSLLNAELGQAEATAERASSEIAGATALVDLLPTQSEDSYRPEPQKKRSFQLSLTTIVVGLLTAVGLAVAITILILARSKPAPNASGAEVQRAEAQESSPVGAAKSPLPSTPVAPTVAAQPAPPAAPTPPSEAAAPTAPIATSEPAAPAVSDTPRPSTPEASTSPSSGQSPIAKPKPAPKATSVAPKSPGKKPRQYVPSGL